jgi:YesN/AraC family two-component response regulator
LKHQYYQAFYLICQSRIISILYLRIRKKNKLLVALAIESAGGMKNPDNEQSTLLETKEDVTESHTSDVKQQQLVTEFARLVETEKLFLQNGLSLQKVAELLGTNRTYLSKAINLELNHSFTTYINRLRIQEAINIISQHNSPKPHINTLAADVGFSSRTSFISSFWKHTGMLPSTFITNYKQLYRESGNFPKAKEL